MPFPDGYSEYSTIFIILLYKTSVKCLPKSELPGGGPGELPGGKEKMYPGLQILSRFQAKKYPGEKPGDVSGGNLLS